MLVSEGHVAASAVLIWVGCAIAGAVVMSGPDLLLWAMSESMVLLYLGSMFISVVYGLCYYRVI